MRQGYLQFAAGYGGQEDAFGGITRSRSSFVISFQSLYLEDERSSVFELTKLCRDGQSVRIVLINEASVCGKLKQAWTGGDVAR